MRNRCYYILLLAFLSLLAKAQEPNHLKIDSLNSSYDEHSPVLSPDGQTLYFTRVGHAANIGGVLDRGDIWLSRKTKSGWSRPEHAGKTINHPGLNGVVGLVPMGSVCIYLIILIRMAMAEAICATA